MATTISTQDLENVRRDIDDIGKAVNENVIVSPRYGEDFKSLPMISAEFQDAIETAAAAGAGENGWTDLLIQTADGSTQRAKNDSFQSQIDGKASAEYLDAALAEQTQTVDAALSDQTQTVNDALSQLSTAATKFYPTLAEANADIANIEVNQPVQVGEAVNGGLWYKATAEATTLTKSAYDPLTQAKADATTKANAAKNEAIATAATDATTKANTAEANAKTYTDGVVFSGLTENIYETNIEVTPSTGTVSPGTFIYAEPALYDGVISKAHGYLRAGVTQFKAKIFQRVENDFFLVASSNIPIIVGASEHILDTPLSIKKGQYVGFFTADAGVEFVLKSGSRPYKYASGDVSKIAVGTLSTNATYLMYFESKRLSLDGVVQNNVANAIKNSTMLEVLSNQLVVANDFIGAEILTGGTTKASVEYVAYTKTVENAGFVDSVDFNLLADDSVAFFSLRMQSDNSYHIINETPYIAYTSGINTAVLEDFYVNEGDILGWKALARNLALDNSAQNATPIFALTRTSANVMTLGPSYSVAQPRIKFNISYAPKALRVVVLTQAQYDALPSKDPNVLYGVV